MRAVDTNVLVRILVRDDEKQAAAADAFVAQGAWISHVVLVETAWVLDSVYGMKPGPIVKGIELLLEHEHLVVQEPDVVAAALEHFRARPSLGFSDCLVLEIARRAGHLPLGTFDRGVGRLEGARKI